MRDLDEFDYNKIMLYLILKSKNPTNEKVIIFFYYKFV